MVHKKLQGWPSAKIAAHLRVSERTVLRWWEVYRTSGWDGLAIKSKRPKTIHRAPGGVIKEVLELRRRKGWGPCKIEAHMKENGVRINHNTIYRAICNAGLNNPIDEPRKTWGRRRFQRSRPNELWQADFKLTDDDRWMLTFLDDHSRFIPGIRIEPDATTEFALRLFKRCTKKHGLPEQVLTDQGAQFYYTDKEGKKHGESTFTQTLRELGVQHIVASKRRPTTIGKVERFHRTYEEEAWRYKTLGAFLRYYNYERPHQALSYLTPARVYFMDRV
jgi:transposase InsO family protein